MNHWCGGHVWSSGWRLTETLWWHIPVWFRGHVTAQYDDSGAVFQARLHSDNNSITSQITSQCWFLSLVLQEITSLFTLYLDNSRQLSISWTWLAYSSLPLSWECKNVKVLRSQYEISFTHAVGPKPFHTWLQLHVSRLARLKPSKENISSSSNSERNDRRQKLITWW